MKFFMALTFLVSTMLSQTDALAQTRGPRYNPPGNRGSTPSRAPSRTTTSPSPSRPRGPSYNPTPSRPTPAPSTGTYRPAPTPSRSTGPRYNPPSPRPTPTPAPRTGNYNPRPTGPRYNPPTPSTGNYNPRPTGPRYNPPRGGTTTHPSRTYYGTPNYHRPSGYSQVPYRRYTHAPYRTTYVHTTHYNRSYDWYWHVWSSYPQYVYVHWIFYPANSYNNGYWVIDNYPYYVFNGYRYRYSTYDRCNYQLVDQWNHQVVQNYWNQSCNTGYDSCSYERDRLNSQMGEFRYFCSETYRDENYDYSTPSYEDSSYDGNVCTDYDYDGYCD